MFPFLTNIYLVVGNVLSFLEEEVFLPDFYGFLT